MNPNPTIGISASNASVCAGGSITYTATGASTYTWNPGGLTGSIVTVSPGSTTTYTVAGSNSFGCSTQNTITATIVPIPVVSPSANPSSICIGNTTTLSAGGASAYSWSPGGLSGSPVIVSPTLTTTYTVSGSSAGCTGTAVLLVTVLNGPTLNPVASPTAICPGGSSTLSASGATSYTWNPGGFNTANISVSPGVTTTYSVTGSNAIGCLTTNTLQVVVNPVPTLSLSSSSASICAGSSATLTASGASIYVWNPGALSGSSIVVSPGSSTTYTALGTNSFGCSSQNTIALLVVPIPTIIPSANPNPVCQGNSSTLTATGAGNYTWNPGGLTGSVVVVFPVVSTTYSINGSASGCSSSTTILLTVATGPTMNPIASPTAICLGGSSNLSASGATGYTWNPGGLGGSNVVVSPTATTIYSVTGNSALGCLRTQTVQVVVNPLPSFTLSASSLSICAGSSTTLTANGTLNYTWMPGSLSGSVVTVSPGSNTTYTVTGANAFGCTTQNTIAIQVILLPIINATASPAAICAGGSSTLTGSGGTSYTWNPGALPGTTVVVSPTTTITYTVIGSALGCSNTKTVQLVVNPLPPVVASATPVSICPGFSSTLNGTGAVSYTWNPGNLTGASVVVSPGSSTTYTVVGSSAAGCTAAATTTVNVFAPATLLAFVSGPSFICSGSSAVLTASGNVITYTWNPGNLSGITVTVTPLVTTTYTVSGTTSNGCVGQSITLVNVSPTPTLVVSASPTAICVGNCATLTANGATSYSWTSGSSTSVALVCPTITTTYSVTGTTGTCSSAPSTIGLPVNALPTLSITASSASICSGTSATLTAAGAVNYTWLPGASNAGSIVVSPLANTNYTLIGVNANGCSNSTVFTLSVSPTPSLSITPSSNTVCSGGALFLTGNGASSYTWSPGGYIANTASFTPTVSTTYTLFGQNGSCNSFTTMLITVVALPNISASANPSAVCAGNSTTLSALGGATYTWLPMNVSGAVVSDSPVGPTTYTVIGQSAAGCLNSASVSIIVIAPPTLTITPTSTAICIGNSVTLTASGAASFTWQPGGQNTASIVSSPTTSSSYTVLGNNGGCVGVKTIQIVVNPLPVVSASISNALICAGNTVSLSAGGASSYTWQPIAQNGSLVTDNPSVSVVYTVTGTDLNSCVNTASVGVTVNPNPTLTVNSSSPAICEGNSVTLSANGALNYTWNPGALNGSPVSDSPSITTTYTVTGSDLNACSATATLVVTVVPNPTMSISPQSSTICAGGTVTLTASGAPNFTWAPGGSNTASIVETPSISTIYTVSGDNAGLCVTSATAEIIVNPLPANVTASVAGIISCAGPTVNMFGSSTSTNVSYFWNGPASFTSAAQNPTAVSVWGNFTLTVTENSTGCLSTVTVNVNTDYSIPSPTLSISSSSITCAIPQVTLNATNTTTNPAFNWAGPGGITGTTQVLTTTLGGVYTVTITDLSSSCTGTASVSISTYTDVAITATILPATCNGTVSNNNGTILVSNFVATDKFDLVSGSTYTGSATYTNATPIATTGIITNTLANPSTTVAYTLRLFDAKGCIKDTTLILNHVECSINPFGIAKSISSIITNTNGSYDVTVKTVVKNYGPVSLSEVKLDENLSAVFASPMNFSIVSPPSVSSGTSQLQVNSAFDGNLESSLTTSNSSIGAGKVDTIVFTVRVDAAGRFGPFSNTIKGTASTAQLPPFTIILADSSQNGLDPDPNNNGNPLDNNEPTVFSFTPRLFFGLTKTGQAIRSDNNSFDFHYSISVHNLGNDTLSNILVKDSLYETAVKSPARYSIKSGPVISGTGNLSANSLYDGRSDTRLIIPGSSKMPPGTKGTISFVINVVTDSVTIYRNSANGTARNSKGTVVSDTSGNGENPDLNNNGVWNEPADNLPTILVVSNPSLFIPEGFSPNGDNVNDLFVIKGLPDGQNEITIYNRWGNKVYHNPDYDNSWDGSTDKGSNKLPQGTYYFVLDMKGSGEKPISGFIVLQY
ncbi:MAG TPA: gliding motility-associated C-terminal domain-containing protein [Bacteroidia bacterium]|nr:gliding motility-associated C-terminal domain-containing protein [Bacteroidia bacterium]